VLERTEAPPPAAAPEGTATVDPVAPAASEPVAVAATLDPAEAASRRAMSEHRRPEIVVKTVIALLAIVALAYLGGHPRVQNWEAKLRISQVITAGFPFVLLGVLARQPGVGIVTKPVLAQMDTLLGVALGWVGLVAGFRFDARLVSGLPAGAARAVALATSIPFAFVVGLTGFALLSLDGGGIGPALRDPSFLRDALILGTAGAMTAKTSTRLLRTAESAGTLARIIRIEELAGVLGLALVAAYFRPHGEVSWQLPGTAWLLLTVGLGATVGIVTCAILQSTEQGRPEFVVLALGSVSFAAGLAGHLHLSPIVITFIAGVVLANFPGRYNARLGSALRRLERPVYLLSLFAIGTLWNVGDWRGWLLMPLFVAARLIGKRVAANLAARGRDLSLGPAEREALAVAPMGPLAIAIVVNAQLLYPGGSVSLIASAVVGGAILTEVIVQLVSHGKLDTLERRSRPGAEHPAASREATG
jgi:Kef-type K+ transport system membrane component KefB